MTPSNFLGSLQEGFQGLLPAGKGPVLLCESGVQGTSHQFRLRQTQFSSPTFESPVVALLDIQLLPHHAYTLYTLVGLVHV